jgi:hypothetical protein
VVLGWVIALSVTYLGIGSIQATAEWVMEHKVGRRYGKREFLLHVVKWPFS